MLGQLPTNVMKYFAFTFAAAVDKPKAVFKTFGPGTVEKERKNSFKPLL